MPTVTDSIGWQQTADNDYRKQSWLSADLAAELGALTPTKDGILETRQCSSVLCDRRFASFAQSHQEKMASAPNSLVLWLWFVITPKKAN